MTPPVGGPRERCPFFGRTSNDTGLILQQCHGKTACRHIPLEDAEAMPVLFSAPLRCPQTWPERFPHPSPPHRSLLQATARKETGLRYPHLDPATETRTKNASVSLRES